MKPFDPAGLAATVTKFSCRLELVDGVFAMRTVGGLSEYSYSEIR
jgi:hypothetical protein